MSEKPLTSHPTSHRKPYYIIIKFSVASYANEPISHRQPLPSNAQAGQSLLWNIPAFSEGRFVTYACPL